MSLNSLQPGKHSELLASRRVVFVFAHHDDEMFVLGLLRALLAEGADVSCVWTVGGNGAPQAVRERESLRAMDMIGLRHDRLHFLRSRDQQSFQEPVRLFRELLSVLNSTTPEDVYVPSYEGGNIDHDLAHALLAHALKRGKHRANVYEFPLYNGYNCRTVRIRRFIPQPARTLFFPVPADVLTLKNHLMDHVFRSQRWTLRFLYAFSRRMEALQGEPVRRVTPDLLTVPPHGGRLLYERIKRGSFRQFRDAIVAVEDWVAGEHDE